MLTERSILENAERRMASLEAAVTAANREPSPVEPFAVSVEHYLDDLRATVNKNGSAAGGLPGDLIGSCSNPRRCASWRTCNSTLAGMLRIGENAGSEVLTAMLVPGGRFGLYPTSAAPWRSRRLR